MLIYIPFYYSIRNFLISRYGFEDGSRYMKFIRYLYHACYITLYLYFGCLTYFHFENWPFENSLIFITQSVTTVGFGPSFPLTPSGRLFSVFHGLLGIFYVYTVALLFMDNFIESNLLEFIVGNYMKGYNKLISYVYIYGIIILIMSGFTILMFAVNESFSLIDSTYLAFQLITSIGFNDIAILKWSTWEGSAFIEWFAIGIYLNAYSRIRDQYIANKQRVLRNKIFEYLSPPSHNSDINDVNTSFNFMKWLEKVFERMQIAELQESRPALFNIICNHKNVDNTCLLDGEKYNNNNKVVIVNISKDRVHVIEGVEMSFASENGSVCSCIHEQEGSTCDSSLSPSNPLHINSTHEADECVLNDTVIDISHENGQHSNTSVSSTSNYDAKEEMKSNLNVIDDIDKDAKNNTESHSALTDTCTSLSTGNKIPGLFARWKEKSEAEFALEMLLIVNKLSFEDDVEPLLQFFRKNTSSCTQAQERQSSMQ